MHRIKLKLSIGLTLTVVSVGATVLLSNPMAPAAGQKTADAVAAYEVVRALVKPSDNEWQWRHIHWMQSVSAAQKQAAAEGKPIMLSGAAQGSVIGCL